MTANYFGTNTRSAGHYLWQLEGEYQNYSGLSFGDFPFNPENLAPRKDRFGNPSDYGSTGLSLGDVTFYKIEDPKGGAPYSIMRIEGSPADDRGGCKSVFFFKEDLMNEQLKEKVLSIPAAKKIIDAMPFEVKW